MAPQPTPPSAPKDPPKGHTVWIKTDTETGIKYLDLSDFDEHMANNVIAEMIKLSATIMENQRAIMRRMDKIENCAVRKAFLSKE